MPQLQRFVDRVPPFLFVLVWFGHRKLNRVELENMLAAMLRTGHIGPKSIARVDSFFMMTHRFLSPKEMANLILSDYQRDVDANALISYKEFLESAQSLSTAQLLNFWVLLPRGAGSFALWKSEKKERFRRFEKGLVTSF